PAAGAVDASATPFTDLPPVTAEPTVPDTVAVTDTTMEAPPITAPAPIAPTAAPPVRARVTAPAPKPKPAAAAPAPRPLTVPVPSGPMAPQTCSGRPAGAGLSRTIVCMATTPSGQGYWLVGADGVVCSYGDAGYFGSLANRRNDQAIVTMMVSPD